MISFEQDILSLDSEYPFAIREITLDSRHNRNENFHWHTSFEITYIRSGHGRYYANGKAYDVQSGDTVMFNSAEPHGWQVLDPEMCVLVVNFEMSFISLYSNQEHLDYLRPIIEHGSNFQNKVDHKGLLADQITSIIREILTEWRKQELGYRILIHSEVLRLLTLLTRHYQGRPHSEDLLSEKQKAMARLNSAFYYIQQNCGRKITLKEVADMVYMSPNYFSHFFHKATETSFSEYVILQRIIRANELMDTTNKSIQTIATECGFNNISNFYRLYKKHTGISPGKRTTRSK